MITPEQLKNELPLSPAAAQTVAQARETIRAILHGADPRLLVITGPCSIHDAALALDYAERLSGLARELEDSLYLVMRVYLEKPRTSLGWKGYLNDPLLDGSCDLHRGLRAGRALLRDILDLGVPCATKALDPLLPAYLQDGYAWLAVGARTTESQTHREMASGLQAPVGFKNATDGNLAVAINAVHAARAPHRHIGIAANGSVSMLQTPGNPDTHIVLRGGDRQSNYRTASIARAEQALRAAGLPPALVVDCSHGNSRKDHRRQPRVARDLARQIENGNDSIVGIMLESSLHEGNQPIGNGADSLRYGVSVTDACIDWHTTQRCLRTLADVVVRSRGKLPHWTHRPGDQPRVEMPKLDEQNCTQSINP